MDDNQTTELRGELDRWRARLDELRLQANLGKMELRDRLSEIENRLEPAYQSASRRLAEVVDGGKDEARVLARSLQAGWKEVLETHRELRERVGSEE